MTWESANSKSTLETWLIFKIIIPPCVRENPVEIRFLWANQSSPHRELRRGHRAPLISDIHRPIRQPVRLRQRTSCLQAVRMYGPSGSRPPGSLPPPMWSCSITSPEQNLRSHSDRLNQSLRFNRVPRWFIRTNAHRSERSDALTRSGASFAILFSPKEYTHKDDILATYSLDVKARMQATYMIVLIKQCTQANVYRGNLQKLEGDTSKRLFPF